MRLNLRHALRRAFLALALGAGLAMVADAETASAQDQTPPEVAPAAPDQSDRVKLLIDRLKSDDRDERAKSAAELQKMGPSARAAADALLKAAFRESGADAYFAALAAVQPERTRQTMEELFRHQRRTCKYRPFSVDFMQTHEDLMVPPLISLITDADVGAIARMTLASMGSSAVPGLTQVLQVGITGERKAACMTLAQIGPAAKCAFRELKNRLSDPSEEVQVHAADALLRTGIAIDVLPNLHTLLKSTKAHVREKTLEVLHAMQPEGSAGQLIPVLIDRLGDEASENSFDSRRYLVTDLLVWQGELAAESLGDALNRSAPTSHFAAHVLAQMGPRAEKAIPHLLKAVESTDTELAAYAIGVFPSIGEKGRVAIPVLRVKLTQGPTGVRLASARALLRMEPELRNEATDAVASILEKGRVDERVKAAELLEDAGDAGKRQTRALRKALGDPTAKVQLAAAVALLKVDSNSDAEAIAALDRIAAAAGPGEALEDAGKAVRQLAENKARVRQPLPGLTRMLEVALQHSHGEIDADEVVEVFGKLKITAQALPTLIRSLASTQVRERRQAERCLIDLGPSIVPTIESMLSEGSVQPSDALSEILKSLRARP